MNEDSQANEFELDVEEADDLESAVRDALRAVEDGESAAGEVGAETRGAPAAADGSAAEELRELNDRYLRLLADYDNFRKRTEREKREAGRYEGFELLRELLPIVDNLERAVTSDGDRDDLRVGVEMILKQLVELLRRQGVERVQAVGEPFDPNVHEAVSRHADEEADLPRVSQEHQAGYQMGERLLRPSVVTVAMPPEDGADEPAAGGESAQ